MIGRLTGLALRMPSPLLRAIAGRPTAVRGDPLDLQVQTIIRLSEVLGLPDTSELDVATARRSMTWSTRLVATHARRLDCVEDHWIAGPAGVLPLRVYTPRVDGAPPLFVYLHGGGWVLGDLESHDRVCRALAAQSGCVVVAVEYRLGPEHRFPAALDDCLSAFRWAHTNAGRLGADASRVALGGDSAGGNMSAVICQLTRGQPARPDLQVLLYPATDFSKEAPAYVDYGRGFLLTRETIHWFLQHYLSNPAQVSDPRISPLLTEDLSDLPPAIVATAGYDVLRDDGRAYAMRLRDAGVEVEHRCFTGMIHGFFSMSGAVRSAERAFSEVCRLVKTKLEA